MRSVATLKWGEEGGEKEEVLNMPKLKESVRNARFRGGDVKRLNNLININFSLVVLKVGPDDTDDIEAEVDNPDVEAEVDNPDVEAEVDNPSASNKHIANVSIYRILNQSTKLAECGMERLTMLCWCCARDNVLSSNNIFKAIDEGFGKVNSLLEAGEKGKLKESGLFDNSVSNDLRKSNVITNKRLGNITFSCAKLNFYMPSLIEYIEKYHRFEEDDDPQATSRHQGRAKGLSNVAWFFARTGIYSERVFKHLEEDCFANLDEWDPRCRSVVMWSICILGKQERHEKFLKFLWKNRQVCPTDAQVLLLTEPTGVDLDCTEEEIDVLKKMVGTKGRVSISRGQDEVFGYLELITDGAVSEERNLNQNMGGGASDWGEYLNVDAVVNDGGKNLVVEYNGPQHYLTAFEKDGGYGFQENGVTLSKMDWLKKRGYEVVVIPFWEWPEEAEEREEFLRTKLGRRRTWAEWKGKG
ncbi:hypothetical protein TrST_g7601 [Triparma strigata]|uniref:RAP domain-containing protein n=1 Tax=Triparma strigata TaxID=1606541 RepID=A0A9W7B6V4_9STRA|nr:hypothetical protein TrST_g7601 [Triparma strigata]